MMQDCGRPSLISLVRCREKYYSYLSQWIFLEACAQQQMCCSRYEMFEPLHERWKQYMKDLTNSQSGVEDRLLTADLHGCLVRVESAKQTCFFGREGIIIKSTLNTFCILSPSNQISIIPKAGTFFSYLYQPKRRVHLNGTKLPSFGM